MGLTIRQSSHPLGMSDGQPRPLVKSTCLCGELQAVSAQPQNTILFRDASVPARMETKETQTISETLQRLCAWRRLDGCVAQGDSDNDNTH